MNNLIDFKKIGNKDIGFLTSLEGNRNVPFEIKRIYFTYNVPKGTKRGMHAHKKLQQLLWCPYGKIEVILDDGSIKQSFLLDSPNSGLLIPNGVWRDIYWRVEGAVLCVAASEYYDENDYIRDYEEFLSYVKEGYWE